MITQPTLTPVNVNIDSDHNSRQHTKHNSTHVSVSSTCPTARGHGHVHLLAPAGARRSAPGHATRQDRGRLQLRLARAISRSPAQRPREALHRGRALGRSRPGHQAPQGGLTTAACSCSHTTDRATAVPRMLVVARPPVGMSHLRLYRLCPLQRQQQPPRARLPPHALCRLYALRVWYVPSPLSFTRALPERPETHPRD